MNEINKELDNKTALGSHCFLLGTDVWQLDNKKKEQIQKLFSNNPKLEKLIRIAKVLDKYQKEINYYQARIRNILKIIHKKLV